MAGGVPPHLRWLFWDVDVKGLDLRLHKKYVIERTLEFGDEAAYRWLFQRYSDEDIIEAVRTSRRISRKTAVMIANFLGFPEGEAQCLKNASHRKRSPS